MADVSKIKFPSGNTYDIKDAVARAGLANIPTKTSDLTNDSGFITSSDIPAGVQPATVDPLMDGTAAIGSSVKYAKEDHVHPTDTTRAPLESPQFTGQVGISDASDGGSLYIVHGEGDEVVLIGFDAGNDPYPHCSTSRGSISFKAPSNSVAELTKSGTIAMTSDITTAISGKADSATTLAGYGITDAYTKGQADSAIASAIAAALTGEFVVSANLPTASASTMGKIYLIPVTDGSGTNVKDEYITWNDNGTYKWEKIGSTDVDLSGLGDLAYTDLEDLSLEYTSFEEALGSNTSFSNSSSSVSFSGGSTDTFVKSYPGATSKLVTTSVPNVTSAGSASTWNFAMGSGADAETLIISGANGSAPTLGTAITAATGSLASNGGGASVMTGLGTASTGSAVTNIGTGTAAAQTITVGSNDTVDVPVAAYIRKL